VEVSADVDDEVRRAYKNNLDRFLLEFLGDRSNAKLCRVINPQDITITVENGELLLARASKLIEVDNQALGYSLHIELLSFECRLRRSAVSFTGYFQFFPVKPRNGDQEVEWRLNRRDSYLGSLVHFLSALFNGSVTQHGFQVRGRRRDGRELGAWMEASDFDVKPVPGTPYKLWKQEGWLVVRYFGEWSGETSLLRVNGDGARFDAAGSLRDPMMVTVGGAWGTYRVSDMLPLDLDRSILQEAQKSPDGQR
jgi:hypothetical protein